MDSRVRFSCVGGRERGFGMAMDSSSLVCEERREGKA